MRVGGAFLILEANREGRGGGAAAAGEGESALQDGRPAARASLLAGAPTSAFEVGLKCQALASLALTIEFGSPALLDREAVPTVAH
jgi:hypothetical protein